jgi:predicted ABC-type ATPase
VARSSSESLSASSSAPRLWLLAGPNGAGKSTYAPTLSASVGQVITADEIARRLSPTAPERVPLLAGREAINRMRVLLGNRESFAIETTLSGSLHLRLARQAKSEGWYLGLVYVGLRSSDVAIRRVRNRKRKGGHGVPATDVRRRYQRSLQNLPIIFGIADEVLVFDNSSARQPMRKVLEARRRRVVFAAPGLPNWLSGALRPALRRTRRRP